MMTIHEAHEALRAKYPGRECEAWHWISGEDQQKMGVKVDGIFSFKPTFEASIEALTVPTNEEKIAKLRGEAQVLLLRAQQLDGLAPVAEAVTTAD